MRRSGRKREDEDLSSTTRLERKEEEFVEVRTSRRKLKSKMVMTLKAPTEQDFCWKNARAVERFGNRRRRGRKHEGVNLSSTTRLKECR